MEFPHTCRECGSPAYEGYSRIECSNEKCVHAVGTTHDSNSLIPPDSVIENLNQPSIDAKEGAILIPDVRGKVYKFIDGEWKRAGFVKAVTSQIVCESASLYGGPDESVPVNEHFELFLEIEGGQNLSYMPSLKEEK
jgi:hypothetical protein